jgi:thiamine pyrophosphate-dependent acetolactate synthase large subunit-like protein
MVITRHEQAAGFMAATMGRLTGKAGLCFSTLGPGALNLATAAAYAQLAGFPMVTISNLPLVLFKHILHRELQTLIMLTLSSKFAFS